MPRVRADRPWPRGRVIRLAHRSRVLEGNPWNDPVDRELPVYLPAGYDEHPARRYPVLWNLAPFTNAGPGQVNWNAFEESLPERLDRLIGEGRMGPVLVASPDCFTSLGGNQYLNSPAVGRYADYLLEELVPLVESELRALPGREHKAAFGKSSGGYGALYHAAHYPEHWAAAASHAGDCGFEWCYRTDFPGVATTLAVCGGDTGRFLAEFWAGERPEGRQIAALMTLAMAASYDPHPEALPDIRLPFDTETCELDRDAWQRWLAHDPLHFMPERADALKSLKGLYLDCGNRDQFHIHYGTRALARRLEAHGVAHVHEEFEGTHSSMGWRYDHSLPYLYRCVAGSP